MNTKLYYRLIAILMLLSVNLRAAESLTSKDLETISSGIECPAQIALRKEGNQLTVIVEVGTMPGATSAPKLMLGVSAAKTIISKPRTMTTSKERKGYWQSTLKVPEGRIAKTPEEWTKLRLAFGVTFDGGPYGQPLYCVRYRHQDGRARHAPFSRKPEDWQPFDLVAYEQRVADRNAMVELAFEQPLDGKATIVIEDEKGKRIRNLVGGAAYLKGKHSAEWDLLDDEGKTVPPGKYKWRSLHHAGIKPDYLFSYCNDGDPAWKTGSGKDMWGPDHSCYLSVTSTKDNVWFLSPVAESGCQAAVTDLSGMKVKTWYAGTSGDKFIIASDGKDVFIAADDGKRQVIRRYEDGIKPFGNGKKEIAWANWVRTGKNFVNGRIRYPQDGNVDFSKREWDTFNLVGFTVAGKELLAASGADQKISCYDAKSGELLRTIPLTKPGALAGLPDGSFYAVSAGSIVHFAPGKTKPTMLLKAGKLQPGAIAADGKGKLYVIDRATHQIAILNAKTGKEIGRLGVPGGHYAGKYDPKRMVNPFDLALAPNGWLWVTENRFNPKRVLAWDLKTGKVVKEKFGPTSYGAPGSGFDPEDITRFIGMGAIWKVDLAKKTAVPSHILFKNSDTMPSAFHWRFLRKDGRTFLIGYAAYISIVELLPDGTGKLLAQYGSAQGIGLVMGKDLPEVFLTTFYEQRGYDTPEKRKGLHDQRLPHNNEVFIWSDANGDGEMQKDELAFTGNLRVGYWGCDVESLDLVIPMANDGRQGDGQLVLHLPIKGWYPKGAPRWGSLKHGLQKIKVISKDKYWGPEAGLFDRKGRLFINTHPLMGFDSNMVQQWSYPNRWNGVHGSHAAPLPEPGQMQAALSFLGNAPLPDGKNDVFVLNGNHGRFFALTSDGFYLDEFFSDVRVGALLNAYLIGGEAFGGFFGRGSDKQYYIISGHTDYRIFRLNGFDTIVRKPGGILTVTPEQIEAADRRTQNMAAVKSKPAQGTITKVSTPPTLDGSGKGWPEAIATWDKDGKFPVKVQAAWDAGNLYLRWDVEDPSPWKNNGDDFKMLFKTGDSVDIKLGTDSSALVNRIKPVPGDLRLLIAPFKGKPIAVLYRHRVPGTKTPIPFKSPWRTENVDEVRQLDGVKIAVKPDERNRRYIVEAAIPLAELGLKPQSGREYRADFGALYGDPDGQIIQLRSYWSNKSTGLVNDVPGEIMLHPNAWGTIKFSDKEAK